MSNISKLLQEIHREVDRITEKKESEPDKRELLSEILLKAIRNTLLEIKNGADSDGFADLTVINFIIIASYNGFSNNEIKDFVSELKLEDL